MTVEHNARARRHLGAPMTASKLPLESPLLADCLQRLKPEPARFAAVAPGRLNIFAGLCDYTGALVLNVPTQEHVCVVVQRADSGVITVIIADASNGDRPFELAAEKLRCPAGIISADEGAVDGACFAARCIIATIAEALRAGVLPPVTNGLTIAVAANDITTHGASRAASICAATLVAASGALDCTIDLVNACVICQRVENDWLKAPVGLADALCALTSEPGQINQVRCDPCSSGGALPLPEGVEFVAVDCGFECKDSPIKFARVRCATFMGRSLIDRIIRHDKLNHLRWEGYLSSISVGDYKTHFRDRIPTKLKGKDYSERFGDAVDPLTCIEQEEAYKIRSRTEHHIYEHDRACKFIECMARASRAKDDQPLLAADEIMAASHWSYGQRCGLGSVETDYLTGLLRDAGPKEGIYGAKITGRGCGGLIAVLKKVDDRADAALEAAVAQYMREKERRARILRGSLPGAALTGPRAV